MQNYVIDFVTTYLEFWIIYIMLVACLPEKRVKEKRAIMLSFVPVGMSCILNLSEIPLGIQIIMMNLILFVCLKYATKIPILQFWVLYIFVYFVVALVEIIQLPFWNILEAGAFHGIAAIGGSIITVSFSVVAYRYLPVYKINEMITKLNFFLLLSVADSFMMILGIVIFIRLKTDKFFLNYFFVVGMIIVLLVINGGEIYQQYKRLTQEKRMKTYEEYLPIVEGLIEQVRIRQHDYHNKLQSIHALAYVYEDFESLKDALLETTEHDMLPDFEMNLLKLNMHLVGGFLFSKIRQADKEGKELHLDIEQYVIKTACTEYEVIEYLGILIDNAIEATNEGETIFAKIGSQDDKLVFEIKNPGPHLTSEFCKNIFKKGYSTKKDGEGCHGIGLYKLNRMVKEYDGKLILENVEVDQKEYISFELRI